MGEARRRWTATEDTLLWELYQIQEKVPTGKCRKVNWNEIARQIPGRSNKDCRKRYYNRFTGGLRKGSWTPEEDERLTALVERYNYRWAMIAQKMETRNADQCSKRWHHCLNPELERSPWTDHENQLLLAAVKTHGSSWKDIQKYHFPTRSANNIKNQYTILSRRITEAVPVRPCCDSSLLDVPRTKLPPTSNPTIQNGQTSREASQDAYSYCSLSSTPQLSAMDYMATIPDMPMNNLDFDAPLPFVQPDVSGQLAGYWPPQLLNGTASSDMVGCESSSMGYGVGVPPAAENSQPYFVEMEDSWNQRGSFERFPNINTAPGF
ncbi:hypothetical protein P175DRAFT_0461054 [Aspergillus ochraceoroseus IBT 24754]|uniref:Myb-like transcription factor n=2 Tax=Aspergillus ochraceoroseus TaxID=138278 RepID=A0A2T5LVM3_9EURO|nr:uncharacterized protein P175DRAFT_0461054 [Aspergillus ochraceoroseus IBT 24754]KKK18303.1 hypothetical protein AOCH_003475 [Aspergillus ochraceoroseus]PTU20330.1 hypothetical protein P175DRAFT_0461054 [Aspergillus ochraceoroseus IBT 24754]